MKKNKYYSNIFSNCNQKENWKHLNTIINPNLMSYPTYLNINIKDQCEHFNNYFSNLGYKINENFVNNKII